jgi:hypothetical protein
MKVAALATLSVLVALPAEAGQAHRQNASPVATCDNNGQCTANAIAPVASERRRQSETQRTTPIAQHRSIAVDANGNMAGVVLSLKTGAHARVGIAYAARFQAYIDDLETNHGARVLFINGIRPGRCSSSSEHPCGKALDVCQRRRGVVDLRCNLPGRVALGQIAASHGLFEGGRWCDSDYGHAQIGMTAAACGDHRVRMVRQ